MTSVGALSTAGVEKGMKVGVIGFGGLGQIGARVAHLRGAQVYVAEINENVWENAREAGAVEVAKAITELTDVELDVIIDYAGFGVTTADALQTVKSSGGGRVVQVGMGKLEATIDTYSLILGRKQLHGSMGGSKEDIEETMRYMASGDLKPTISEIDFEEIPAGIQQLADGAVVGRLVAKVTA